MYNVVTYGRVPERSHETVGLGLHCPMGRFAHRGSDRTVVTMAGVPRYAQNSPLRTSTGSAGAA